MGSDLKILFARILSGGKQGSTHRRGVFAAASTAAVGHSIGIVMRCVDRINRHTQNLSGDKRERCIGAGQINGTDDDGDCTIGLQAAGGCSGFGTTGPASGGYAYADLPALQLVRYNLLLLAVGPKRGCLGLLQALEKAATGPGALIYGWISLFQAILQAEGNGIHLQFLAQLVNG